MGKLAYPAEDPRQVEDVNASVHGRGLRPEQRENLAARGDLQGSHLRLRPREIGPDRVDDFLTKLAGRSCSSNTPSETRPASPLKSRRSTACSVCSGVSTPLSISRLIARCRALPRCNRGRSRHRPRVRPLRRRVTLVAAVAGRAVSAPSPNQQHMNALVNQKIGEQYGGSPQVGIEERGAPKEKRRSAIEDRDRTGTFLRCQHDHPQ